MRQVDVADAMGPIKEAQDAEAFTSHYQGVSWEQAAEFLLGVLFFGGRGPGVGSVKKRAGFH